MSLFVFGAGDNFLNVFFCLNPNQVFDDFVGGLFQKLTTVSSQINLAEPGLQYCPGCVQAGVKLGLSSAWL